METDDDDLESKEMGVDTKGRKEHKIILKYLFFLLSLVFALALIGVVTQYDFSPHSTEHAQELSKHRTREEGKVEFHTVSNIEKFPHKEQRLPKDLKPVNYKLDLRVNLTTLKYRGIVKTRILCEKTTRYVILHCGDLEVLNVSVTEVNNHNIAINRILTFKEYQQLCIELKGDLSKGGSYFVTLQFKNKISDKLEGFYKSWYRSETGEKRLLAVSHFEPAHARKAFPCFDEPSFKASFNISIIHDPQFYALSNMPRAWLVTRKDGLVEEHFLPSVNMSTYLVAFAVVDFKYKEKMASSGVLVRVHAPPSDFDRLEYALDTGVKMLSFYEKLFRQPFPLPKLDLLAVPDFLNGAMEEWGLVMFRRALLMFDEQFISTDAKVKMTKVIAHELAHQWFGNLVTPKWWNDLWLNEGFAVFVEDEFGANYVMKGWDMDFKRFEAVIIGIAYVKPYLPHSQGEMFLLKGRRIQLHIGNKTERETVVSTSWQSALHGDSMRSSHPISVEVQKPEEIDDIFDAISYQKGAMILRMLMNFLGVEKFLIGIKRYLETYKYGNADAEELWDAIGEASGNINVKNIMKVWTDQKGFPIVSIRKRGRVFHIEQEDVLERLIKDKNHEQKRKRWYLPISYFTESDPTPRQVTIPPDTQSYPLKTASTSGWIKANINATGFFMVNYDEENWKKLALQLRKDHKVFSPNDRAGLIHDVFTLTCQGLLDPVLALNLSTYLVREKYPVPWALARSKSKCLMGLLSKVHKLLYKNYLWHLQDHLIDLVGMEDTGTDLERVFRYDVLSEAMRSGQRKEISERFIQLFSQLRKTPLGSLPGVGPNFRYLAFSFGVNKSSEEDWHYLWSVYQQSPFDTDRKFLMSVITSFNTKNIRLRNLLFSLDENRVRPQDTLFWIEMMGKGCGKTDDRWDFILKHWKTLARRYAGSYKFGNLIKAVAGSFHTKDQLKVVKKTFQSLNLGEIAIRAQSQTVEKIQHNIACNPAHLKKNEERIVRWLKDYKQAS